MSRFGARLENGATLLLLALSPWIGLGLVQALGGVDLGAGLQPAYLLLILAWSGRLLRSGPRALVADLLSRHSRLWLFGLAALLLSGIGVQTVVGTATAVEAWSRFARQLIQWLLMAGFALHLEAWLRDESGRTAQAIRALACGVLFQVFYGVGQAVHFYRPTAFFAALERVFTSNPAILSGSEELYLGRDFVGVPRLRGTACEPLYLGNFLLFALPWLVWRARRDGWALAAAVGGLLLLGATWSRGAWLAGCAGGVAGAAVLWTSGVRPSRRGLWWIAGGGGLALVAFLLLGGDALLQLLARRIAQSFSGEDWSNLTRVYSMQAAWRAFLAAPWTGVGWGQFAFHFPLLVDPMGLQSQFSWPVVNNYPLKVLCETGVVGFAAFVGGVVVLVRRGWLARFQPQPGRLAAATAALTGTWLQLFTFSQYNLPHIWLAVGFYAAVVAVRDGETGS